MKIREILKKIVVILPVAVLGISAFAGSKYGSAIPFIQTVTAAEYGSKDDDEKEEEPVISEQERKDIDYRTSEAGKIASNTSVSAVSIGTSVHTGGTSIGGGVSSVFPHNEIGRQVQATGCNVSGGELPYTRVEPVNAVTKAVMQNAATAQGFVPGGVMNIEIGNFTTVGGYKPCDKLNGAINVDVYITPIPGYTPGVMMLLPDGSTRLLNANEFDASLSGHDFGNNTQLYTIRTTAPNATYMTVYMPAR